MSRYYNRYELSTRNKYAERHIEEAKEFSEEMGGTDEDVKQYFFSLPSNELNAIFCEYGKKYGASPEDYARKTFYAWRTGKRRMSGLVAKRLFDLLPPKMPIEKKYELADNIWRHYGPHTNNHFTINQYADINRLSEIINNKLDATINIYNIPQYIKNRFRWLSSGDITAEEKLLNYFRQRQKNLVIEKLRCEIPVLQNQIKNHPEITKKLNSELRINNNIITINVVNSQNFIIEEGDVNSMNSRQNNQSSINSNQVTDYSWLWWVIGFIAFIMLIK